MLGILSISTFGFSQAAPAGVNLGALELWLDGSDPENDGTPPVAGPIAQWDDKSTSIDHLDAPTASSSFIPDYLPSDAAFNGAGVLVFDSLDIFTKNVNWSGDHTIFIVFMLDSAVTADGTAVFSSGDGGGGNEDDRFEIQLESSLTNYTYHTTDGAPITESVFGTQAAALAAPVMYSATRSGNNVVCYNNGVQSSTMTTTTGDEFDEYVLNANREETGDGNNCKIAEVIIYDVVLTASERARINNYLACKYGLTIAGASPGGVNPCDVSLWMKADLGLDTTGLDVNIWEDQSTHSFNGTATATEEPLFNPMDNNFNPSLTFDSTNNDAFDLGAVTASDGLMMAANDFSLYTVAFVDNTTDGILFADRLCKDENGYHLRFNSATNSWMFEGGAAGSGAYTAGDSTAVETVNTGSDYSLVGMARSGANYTLQTHEGGAETGTTTTSVSYSSTATERYIGTEAACSSTNYHGNVSEIIAIGATVSATEDIQIQSYLGIKYGLSLDPALVNYLASDGATVLWDNTIATYWNDVAGIGQDDGSLLDQRISKSQDKSGIVTIASDNNFTLANSDASRTSLGDGNFLLWGNNNVAASTAWTTTGAPSGYAVSPERWLVSETGTVGGVNIQVDVNDAENNMPTFFGDLYFVHGSNIAAATPTLMTETSLGSGIWEVTGIDFADGDFFTFTVENELLVEFSSPSSSTVDETSLGPFTTVLQSGIVNVATSYTIVETGTGGAIEGTDYTFADQLVNIVPGDYNGPTTYTITPLPVLIQDTDIEGNEIVQFTFTVTDGCVEGDADGSTVTTNQHNLIITDDDAYNVSIQKLSDGDEGGPLDATFEVFVVGGSNPTTITGDITWSGTATAGADYDGSTTSFTLTSPTASQTINLNTSNVTYDDALLEGTETIIGTISNLSATTGTAVTAVDEDTAFVSDDEVTGILISIDTVNNFGTTEEGGAALQYVISLDGSVVNNSGSAINGSIAFTGTATGGGTDFTENNAFSIPNGVNSTTVSINTSPDVLVELTESVIATITLTNGIGAVNPAAASATAFITDEDTTGLTVAISVVGGGSGVTEGSVASIDYNITLSGGKVNGTGADITGSIGLSGTATNLVDYNGGAGTYAIPNGASSGVYSVTIVDDGVAETMDLLTATINSVSIGSPSPTNNSVDQNIFDDDTPGLQIAIGSPTDTTESPIGTPFVSFEVAIVSGGTSASNITGTIGYTTGPTGTATPGIDFTQITGYTILAGATSTIVQVPVIDDGLTEPDELVIANLTGVPSLGSYNNITATATIFDDDAQNLTIDIDTIISATEGTTLDMQFIVSLGFGTINGTGAVIDGQVNYGGTATTGVDFNGDLIFEIPDGQSVDTVFVSIVDDLLVEYTDTVIAIISNPSLGAVGIDSSMAFLYDNDLDSLSLSISGSATNGAEGGADVEFTIAIDDGLSNGLGVPLTGDLLFTGTAGAGFDFNDIPQFSIPDGAAFTTHVLPVIDDPSLELQELVIATLSNLMEGTISPTDSTDTVYIDDNDLSNAELQITTSDGVEMPNPHNPVFIVSFVGGLQNETGAPITGTINLGGTATEGVGNDYLGVVTFSIDNDSSQHRIPFVIQDDLLEEDDETIIATISNPSPAAVGISATNDIATALILDDDTDVDNDGLSDLVDPNIGNIDSDCDGIFDGCDADADGDGLPDDGGIDLTNNGTDDVFYDLFSIDTDLDGIKDTCDSDADGNGTIENGPDQNEDGLNDNHWPTADNDLDLLPDHVDPNDNNIDTDGDGITDGADADVNGDGILDNGCDDDGDGIHNQADADFNPGSVDNDNDGIIAEWDMNDITYDGQQINYIVSPDGDGVNETLTIQGIQVIDRHKLTIYNRFGEPVYIDEDYQNNWSGEVNQTSIIGGDKLLDGVYFYTLEVGDEARAVRGYIEIRR
ncbi:MAG: gliding motility-associated C-terminal domain-containing protein [Crocinitomicaceae bacterium]|nr:gliding motility-associated C-terminal domain-containing protein [Crocinitomicaceae bacterium]